MTRCKRCGGPIYGTGGHAASKAIAGGLLLGPVGAIAGAAHGLSKEQGGPDLCAHCRMFLNTIKSSDELLESIRREEEEEERERRHEELLSKLEEDPIKALKLRYAKGEITKEEYEQMRKDIEG